MWGWFLYDKYQCAWLSASTRAQKWTVAIDAQHLDGASVTFPWLIHLQRLEGRVIHIFSFCSEWYFSICSESAWHRTASEQVACWRHAWLGICHIESITLDKILMSAGVSNGRLQLSRNFFSLVTTMAVQIAECSAGKLTVSDRNCLHLETKGR